MHTLSPLNAHYLLLLTRWAWQSLFFDSKQDMVVQTALSRRRFDMNCPEVTPTSISREVLDPGLQGPWVYGINRAEYTTGATGCGRRETFVVTCPDGGESCVAAGPGGFHGCKSRCQSRKAEEGARREEELATRHGGLEVRTSHGRGPCSRAPPLIAWRSRPRAGLWPER
jgi:hypothetical protein